MSCLHRSVTLPSRSSLTRRWSWNQKASSFSKRKLCCEPSNGSSARRFTKESWLSILTILTNSPTSTPKDSVTICLNWNRNRSEMQTHCICKHTRTRGKLKSCMSWRRKSARSKPIVSGNWGLLTQRYPMLTSEGKIISQLLQRNTKITVITWLTALNTRRRWTLNSTKTNTVEQ